MKMKVILRLKNQPHKKKKLMHCDKPRRKNAPGNRSYVSTTDYGKKTFVVGDSHIKIINETRFSNSFKKAKPFIKN